jgi:hypothetical protein
VSQRCCAPKREGRARIEQEGVVSKRITIILTLSCFLGAGCTFSHGTQLPRSASQQVLATQAVLRALDKLEFPDIRGKKVLVNVGAPGEAVDPESGALIQRSDPVEGHSEGESTTVLMVFAWDETDVEPLPPPDGGLDAEP